MTFTVSNERGSVQDYNYLPLGMIDTDREWMDDAYCRVNNIEPDTFFPEKGSWKQVHTVINNICSRCTVREKCLNYALNNHINIGIFGGKSGKERGQIARERYING
jgi:WhiB family redox-sensing transcriptional regulator